MKRIVFVFQIILKIKMRLITTELTFKDADILKREKFVSEISENRFEEVEWLNFYFINILAEL